MVTRLLLVALPLVVLVACGGGSAPAPEPAARPVADEDAVITIKTFHFAPNPITVEPGTTVTFRNEDEIAHNVTAGTRTDPAPDGFRGAVAGLGDTFELTLDEPGAYAYFCELHAGEGMTGLIVVQG